MSDPHAERIRQNVLQDLREAQAEIERLRIERLHWEHQNGLLEAEIGRLTAALHSVLNVIPKDCQMADDIRATLEGKP